MAFRVNYDKIEVFWILSSWLRETQTIKLHTRTHWHEMSIDMEQLNVNFVNKIIKAERTHEMKLFEVEQSANNIRLLFPFSPTFFTNFKYFNQYMHKLKKTLLSDLVQPHSVFLSFLTTFIGMKFCWHYSYGWGISTTKHNTPVQHEIIN